MEIATPTPEIKEKLIKETYERAFLASVTKIFAKITFETDWSIVTRIFGFSSEAEEDPRFYKSHYFHDDDYPSCLMHFLESAYTSSPENAVEMVKYVMDELKAGGKLQDSEIGRYPALKILLEKNTSAGFSFVLPKTVAEKYLEIKELPDDFYRDLVEMINKAYGYELYVAVCLLTRKMIENLIVDILRKKFGMANLDLFYEARFHGFKDFKTLIINFENHLAEYQKIVPSLDLDFVKMLHTFREQGNGAAHTLEVRVTREELVKNKVDLEFVTKTLVRIFK